MFTSIVLFLLSTAVLLVCLSIRKMQKKIEMLSISLDVVDKLFAHTQETQKEHDFRLTEMRKKLEQAEDLIEAHAEAEKEAAKSERLFQEGLTNLLNYGVK